MDNITHTLFALTLGRTPLGRGGRGTTTALLLASNAPDVDVVTVADGALNYLQWHRGPTHGLLGVIGLSLLTAAFVVGVQRVRPAASGPRDASPATLLLVSLVGLIMHIAMDVPTAYGTRLLSPFDWHWFAVDWMPIIDVYLLVILGTGLIVGRSRQRALGRSRAAGYRSAAVALALMAGYYGLRATTHHRALQVAAEVFGSRLPERCGTAAPETLVVRWPDDWMNAPGDACLVAIAALPTFDSPFRWRLVAELSNSFEVDHVDLLADRVSLLESSPTGRARPTARVYPVQWPPAAVAAARSTTAQIFLGFSRFPAIRTLQSAEGVTTVWWFDLRFGDEPPVGRLPDRGGLFSITVVVNPDSRILDHRLGR